MHTFPHIIDYQNRELLQQHKLSLHIESLFKKEHPLHQYFIVSYANMKCYIFSEIKAQ